MHHHPKRVIELMRNCLSFSSALPGLPVCLLFKVHPHPPYPPIIERDTASTVVRKSCASLMIKASFYRTNLPHALEAFHPGYMSRTCWDLLASISSRPAYDHAKFAGVL